MPLYGSNFISLVGNQVINGIKSFAQNLGLGISLPVSKLHIDAGNATASNVKFTAGTTTGQTITDGFNIGISSSGSAEINQLEPAPLNISTNGINRISINSSGDVLLNSTTPSSDTVSGAVITSGGVAVRGNANILGKINIATADSNRNYALAVSNSTVLTANPSGSIRSTNIDPFFYLSNVAVTQPIYGNNLKVEVGSNANAASSNSSVITAINAYSLISNAGGGTLTIANNRCITCNADVGSNLSGVTITNNTAIHVDSVASRGTTTITNAYGIYITRPNHGTNRYGLFLEAPTGGTINWSLLSQGKIGITDTTASTSSTTGALVVSGGIGIGGSLVAGQLRLSANNTPPASAADTGVLGEIRIDSNFIYYCTGINTWKRTPLSTW